MAYFINGTTIIMTLNVNDLNAPTKRQRVAEWIMDIYAASKRPISDRKIYRD